MEFVKRLWKETSDWSDGPPPPTVRQFAFVWAAVSGVLVLWALQGAGLLIPLIIFIAILAFIAVTVFAFFAVHEAMVR